VVKAVLPMASAHRVSDQVTEGRYDLPTMSKPGVP
jgi:hypothetical protein